MPLHFFMVQEENMKKLTRLLWALALLCLLVSSACSKKETTQADPNWERVLSFDDDPLIESIQSLTVFKDQLYAAAADWYAGGTVWRTKDGGKWERVSEPGFGTHANYMTAYLFVFQDKLYAGTGCPEWHNLSGVNEDYCGVSMVYRTEDGKKWEAVDIAGFGDKDNQYVPIFAEFQGRLYAGTYNPKGTQIWRSQTGDPGSWEKVMSASPNNDATGLIVFKNQLYAIFATLGMTSPLSVWHTADGENWEQVIFKGNTCNFPGGITVFREALYFGVMDCNGRSEIWWTEDGNDWKVTGQNGFGTEGVALVTTLGVYQENLVAMAVDMHTGMEVWESADGQQWKQVNQDAFGSLHSTWNTWPTKGIAVFKDRLYVGTWGRGEIFRSSFPSQ
jgi:hypothetical protein